MEKTKSSFSGRNTTRPCIPLPSRPPGSHYGRKSGRNPCEDVHVFHFLDILPSVHAPGSLPSRTCTQASRHRCFRERAGQATRPYRDESVSRLPDSAVSFRWAWKEKPLPVIQIIGQYLTKFNNFFTYRSYLHDGTGPKNGFFITIPFSKMVIP